MFQFECQICAGFVSPSSITPANSGTQFPTAKWTLDNKHIVSSSCSLFVEKNNMCMICYRFKSGTIRSKHGMQKNINCVLIISRLNSINRICVWHNIGYNIQINMISFNFWKTINLILLVLCTYTTELYHKYNNIYIYVIFHMFVLHLYFYVFFLKITQNMNNKTAVIK